MSVQAGLKLSSNLAFTSSVLELLCVSPSLALLFCPGAGNRGQGFYVIEYRGHTRGVTLVLQDIEIYIISMITAVQTFGTTM